MKYNAQGMRIQKDEATYMTNYFYDSQNRLSGIDVHGTILYFYYDADGNVTAFNHNGGMYYYVKNVQGDIIRIINEGGTTLVTYTYDAWGNILKQTDTTNYNLANVNPFKYRSYVYDYETGLYYLNSRYYDPTTGRFLDADIYCDTMSSVLGTNMFTYCNNNPVNQIDPEGTNAYWLQFGDAVKVGPAKFGHTSLLLQDASNNWWYFYWGPKHVILRPCGKETFSNTYSLTSYLCGFDPRPHHNYYVYATNVINDKDDIRYKSGSDYYLKCHDKAVTGWMYFLGNFTDSFNYAKTLLTNLYINSNATQLIKKVYENGKATYIYDVCAKTFPSNNVNQIVPDHIIPADYYYSEIKLNSNYKGNLRGYAGLSYNCVQVSMEILLKGTFSGTYHIYYKKLLEIYGNFWEFDMSPNNVYNKLKIL